MSAGQQVHSVLFFTLFSVPAASPSCGRSCHLLLRPIRQEALNSPHPLRGSWSVPFCLCFLDFTNRILDSCISFGQYSLRFGFASRMISLSLLVYLFQIFFVTEVISSSFFSCWRYILPFAFPVTFIADDILQGIYPYRYNRSRLWQRRPLSHLPVNRFSCDLDGKRTTRIPDRQFE